MSSIQNGLSRLQLNEVNSVAIYCHTDKIRSDWSELVCVIVSIATTLTNQELAGRPHPYHVKTG